MHRRLAIHGLSVLALCVLSACRGVQEARTAVHLSPKATVERLIEEARVRTEVHSVVPSRPWSGSLVCASPSLTRVEEDPVEARLAPVEALMHRPPDGPVDLGLPVVIDLGAGEAPFDDGVAPFHPGEPVRGGFSDSVLSLKLRGPTGGRTHVFGMAAVLRDQDLTVLESLPEADFSFVVLGFGASF